MGVYSMTMETVETYTGLSPTEFFTIAILMVIVYNVVCGMFVGPEAFKKPTVSEPLQLGFITEQQLRSYDGSDPNKPILISIRGQIYDVSTAKMFYGSGGPYARFAGREASRALALLSFDPKDCSGNLEGLGDQELAILQDWEDKFIDKYPQVGQLVQQLGGEKED